MSKSTYACCWLHRNQGGKIRDAIAHVASSDVRFGCIGNIVGEDLDPHK